LCDVKISYIGMTTRHLGIRVQEHLHHKTLKKTLKSPFQDHIYLYGTCNEKKTNI